VTGVVSDDMTCSHLKCSEDSQQQQAFTRILHSLQDAFQCIAQPNTALHDCILYTAHYLRSKHFTGLCKSVHPWGRVSEIQSIKEASCTGNAVKHRFRAPFQHTNNARFSPDNRYIFSLLLRTQPILLLLHAHDGADPQAHPMLSL